MNYKFTIAQAASYREETVLVDGKEVKNIIVKPNTHRPFLLLDELMVEDNFEECCLYHRLKEPMLHFTEVWKCVDNVETWTPYSYYLVAHNVGLKEVFQLIKAELVWTFFTDPVTKKPLYLPTFGDKPIPSVNGVDCNWLYVTCNDTHAIVGRSPRRVQLIKRR